MRPANISSAADAGSTGILPLVIGVTGHRHLDVDHYPDYRLRIVELLTDLRRRYPATPLRVLSALAEGADRLAAEVALEFGCELVVPLPFEPAEYERDFPQSVTEFRALLARVPAEHVFVVPLAGGSTASTESAAERREMRYREVGTYVAAQCHILIALWDGHPHDSDAGTAAIVRLKLESPYRARASTAHGLDSDDGGPVFHVKAPRTGSSSSARHPARWLFPHDTDASMFHTLYARMERFNQDSLRAGPIDGAGGTLIPDLAHRPAGDRTVALTFDHADRLARHYQRLTHGVLRLILCLAAALALTFEVYAELMGLRALLAVYLLIFASLGILFLWQRRRDAQGRYLDYRALAEGLRVQFYWRLAGLQHNAAENYLRKQLDELRWIREALRGANSVPPPTEPRLDLVMQHWLRGQSQYYRARAQLQQKRIHRIERISTLCVASGLLATLSLILFWNLLGPFGDWHHWLVLTMGFAPIAAALCETYGERFGLRPQAHQYARFATIFARAEAAAQRMEANRDPQRRLDQEQRLIAELGRESLMESGDWVLLLRDRPIVLPKG